MRFKKYVRFPPSTQKNRLKFFFFCSQMFPLPLPENPKYHTDIQDLFLMFLLICLPLPPNLQFPQLRFLKQPQQNSKSPVLFSPHDPPPGGREVSETRLYTQQARKNEHWNQIKENIGRKHLLKPTQFTGKITRKKKRSSNWIYRKLEEDKFLQPNQQENFGFADSLHVTNREKGSWAHRFLHV